MFKSILCCCFFCLCFFVGFEEVLFASTEEHAAHSPSVWELKLYWLNFFLYLAVVYFLFRKSAAAAWTHRRLDIKQSVDDARHELTQAQKALSEAEEKLSRVKMEIEKLNSQIRDETMKESAQVIEEAKKKASRIVSQAGELVAAEGKSLEAGIRRELAELIVAKAESVLRQEINHSTDKGLRDSTVDDFKLFVH